MNNFVTMIKYFQTLLQTNNAYHVAIQVGKHTNLVKELFSDKTTEGLAKYENIQELLNSIKEWTETPDNDEGELIGTKDLGSYLQQITLLTDADNDNPNATDAVKVMTIHAAKGLEFSCVFVAGIEETIFPNAMAINTREELEEERRLFYVAVTRAKQRLWLTYANARYRFGQLVQNEPSRFLDELPQEFLDESYAGTSRKNSFNNMGSAYERMQRGLGFETRENGRGKTEKKPSYLSPVNHPQTVDHIPSTNFQPSDTSALQQGDKVEHQKFGFGEVLKVEGSAHNPVASIKFEKNGEKKIMLNYAKLRIL
jgi:DNA helicase-2/ATP-dependent DNA helicase PcrA